MANNSLARISFLILFIGASSIGYAQNKEDQSLKAIPVERQANYPGGHSAMNKFILENLEYPEYSIQMEAEGRVMVKFIVEKDGRLSNIKVVGTTCNCQSTRWSKRKRKKFGEPNKKKACLLIEKASVEVVTKMPNWNPAVQREKPVRMFFQLPLHFELY